MGIDIDVAVLMLGRARLKYPEPESLENAVPFGLLVLLIILAIVSPHLVVPLRLILIILWDTDPAGDAGDATEDEVKAAEPSLLIYRCA